MSKEVIFFLIVFCSMIVYNPVQTCGCAKFTYKPYMESNKYLARLPDSKKLNNLAFIGTHLSLSYNAEDEKLRTQELNIEQQLKYGIRVLDISVRPSKSKYFKIIASHTYLNLKLHNILFVTDKFLDDNPGEFIIMFIQSEHTAVPNATINNCKIIDNYIDDVWGGWRLVKNWDLNDPIGMYRNRILLASADPSFFECAFNINTRCAIDNQVNQRVDSHIYNIHHIQAFILQSVLNSLITSRHCNIIDISVSDNDRRDIVKDGGYKIGNTCVRPVNHLMTEMFQFSKRALTIVLADYVTQELIDKINDKNFRNSSWRGGWE